MSFVLIKRKYIRKLCFPIAFFFFFGAGRDVCADSFLNPARNSYSLSKTLDRPFLQSSPVPQVWQTISSPEEFKKDMTEAITPETREDILSDVLAWQEDTEDFQQSFQTLTTDEWKKDNKIIAEILNEEVALTDLSTDEVLNDMREVDRYYDYSPHLEGKVPRKMVLFANDLADDETYFASLDDIARIYEGFALWNDLLSEKDKQEMEALMDSFEVSLDQAEDIYYSEMPVMREVQFVDETVWSLMVGDLLDLSTGMNVLLYDETYPKGEKNENVSRSASLLDMGEKTDQIQEYGFPYSRQSLIGMLEKNLKNSVAKKDAE